MKKITKYPAALLLTFLLSFCGEQGPTEIIKDDQLGSDDFDVEILSPSEGNELVKMDYDSTGAPSVINNHRVNINIAIVKSSHGHMTLYHEYAGVSFSDLNDPVYSPGGRLIGYRTREGGSVKFNGKPALRRLNKIRYFNQGAPRDTILGVSYEYMNRGKNGRRGGNFGFNENIQCSITGQDINGNFVVPMPEEITGSAEAVGSRFNNDLRLRLKWNGSGHGKIDIIIGGVLTAGNRPFPLFLARTGDDGSAVIPYNLMRDIPFGQFRHFVVSFVKKHESRNAGGIEDSYIISQSVHNAILEIN